MGPDLVYNDFELAGTDNQPDVFNFDLTGDDKTWHVYGFDSGTDLLHIIGAEYTDLMITDVGDDITVAATVDSVARLITLFDVDGVTVDDFQFA